MTDMSNDKQTKVIPKNVNWGVYVWRNADGTALSDGDGRVLSMNGFKGDLEAMRQMSSAATYYGSGDGSLAFIPGSLQVTDNQHDDQMEAFIAGDPIPGDIDD